MTTPTHAPPHLEVSPPEVPVPPARQVGWRRLRSPGGTVALLALCVAAVAQALGTVVAGRLAQHPSAVLVWWLLAAVLGAAVLDTVGRYLWSGVVDRAEGRLRDHLLEAALHQPLAALQIERGELVLLLGQVGAGRSSLLRTLAGLVDYRGSITWNGHEIDDAEVFLRPGQVAYVAQVPRVLSGSFADNVRLGFVRDVDRPVLDARLTPDVESAGGTHALVGHRGVRLSGGQVQRLALARALAADAELLLADGISSALDATTEIELWQALRGRSATVVGATSKRAALAKADRVVVLAHGRASSPSARGRTSRRSGAISPAESSSRSDARSAPPVGAPAETCRQGGHRCRGPVVGSRQLRQTVCTH